MKLFFCTLFVALLAVIATARPMMAGGAIRRNHHNPVERKSESSISEEGITVRAAVPLGAGGELPIHKRVIERIRRLLHGPNHADRAL